MIKEAIDRIISLVPLQIHVIDGETYASADLKLIKRREQHTPDILTFSTLTGLVDFAVGGELPDVFFHIIDYDKVVLRGGIQVSNANNRFCFAAADLPPNKYVFDQYYGIDEFIIKIQSMFIRSEITEHLLSVIGNLANEYIQTNRDDGITQSVQVKTGITTKANAPIENPLFLKPYRTFREIDQPESDFVFRIKKADNGLRCALFEADGGIWKLLATESIKNWLKKHCKDIPAIG